MTKKKPDYDSTTAMNRFKARMATISDGCPRREFVEYRPPKAMLDAQKRCEELMAWPSRFA